MCAKERGNIKQQMWVSVQKDIFESKTSPIKIILALERSLQPERGETHSKI